MGGLEPIADIQWGPKRMAPGNPLRINSKGWVNIIAWANHTQSFNRQINEQSDPRIKYNIKRFHGRLDKFIDIKVSTYNQEQRLYSSNFENIFNIPNFAMSVEQMMCNDGYNSSQGQTWLNRFKDEYSENQEPGQVFLEPFKNYNSQLNNNFEYFNTGGFAPFINNTINSNNNLVEWKNNNGNNVLIPSGLEPLNTNLARNVNK